ncbi:MAG: hypothetical protein JWR19_4045 [Pedosphaera sp.]|nr:hypothetical protein [Pedosphaera sp.]
MSLPSHDPPLAKPGLFFPRQPQTVPEKIFQVESASQKPPDIARLTSRMTKSDEAAYREFYDLYFNRLLRYLLVLTGGAEAAARDALQLTLMRIVRHIKPFTSEETFWSWLTVLARSSIVDETRKRNRYLALLDRFFRSEQLKASASQESEDRVMVLLEKHLNELPLDDRNLMERKYLEGESVREIAGAVSATEKAVESRLSRIRKQLKETNLLELKK